MAAVVLQLTEMGPRLGLVLGKICKCERLVRVWGLCLGYGYVSVTEGQVCRAGVAYQRCAQDMFVLGLGMVVVGAKEGWVGVSYGCGWS